MGFVEVKFERSPLSIPKIEMSMCLEFAKEDGLKVCCEYKMGSYWLLGGGRHRYIVI